MSTRVTHAISKSLDVKFWPDGGGDFQLRGCGFVADLTPEQATQLRHHLTVWLEAGAQAGIGKPVVLGVDMASGPDVTVKTVHAPDGSLTHFEQLGNVVQEKLATMEVGGPSQGIDADRKAWVESLNAWVPRADGDGSVFGCTPSNPVHLLTGQHPTPSCWSATAPTEPGWYWAQTHRSTFTHGMESVYLSSFVNGTRYAKIVGSTKEYVDIDSWGWKWWSERLSPPSVPHG